MKSSGVKLVMELVQLLEVRLGMFEMKKTFNILGVFSKTFLK